MQLGEPVLPELLFLLLTYIVTVATVTLVSALLVDLVHRLLCSLELPEYVEPVPRTRQQTALRSAYV